MNIIKKLILKYQIRKIRSLYIGLSLMGDMECFTTFMHDNHLLYGICLACYEHKYNILHKLVISTPEYPHYGRFGSMYYWDTPTLGTRQRWDLETIISKCITPRIDFLNFLYEQL